jgi:hypothetical protein
MRWISAFKLGRRVKMDKPLLRRRPGFEVVQKVPLPGKSATQSDKAAFWRLRGFVYARGDVCGEFHGEKPRFWQRTPLSQCGGGCGSFGHRHDLTRHKHRWSYEAAPSIADLCCDKCFRRMGREYIRNYREEMKRLRQYIENEQAAYLCRQIRSLMRQPFERRQALADRVFNQAKEIIE